MAIRVVSVNIENSRHLKTVEDFLAREDGEIVCLMEVIEGDVLKIAGARYPYVVFAPNDVLPSGEKTGVAILSKQVIFEVEKYYFGEDSVKFIKLPRVMATHVPALLFAKVVIGDQTWQIGTIHFSWTPDGRENEWQEKHFDKLLPFLKEKGEFVLCGDFNIPRGYKHYEKLKEIYKDNIPTEIETTIDPSLHRINKVEKGKLKFVVDYVWTTPKYIVNDLRVEQGVSDHCGVTCVVDMPTRTVLVG